MPIFATGTTGTIGRHLTTKVTPLNFDLSTNDFNFNSGRISKNDYLLHLAGIVGASKVEENLGLAHQINVSATYELGKQFLATQARKFVYVSTSHVYAPSTNPINETGDINPPSHYAQQKREAELVLTELFSEEPHRLCIVRVFSVLDWDVAPFTLGGGISKLSDPNSTFILNNCDDVRDFLTPSTIASALVEVSVDSNLSGTLNLSSGRGITVREAAQRMLSSISVNGIHDRMKPGTSSNPVIIGDNSRIKDALPGLDLAWTPSTRA